MPDSHLSVLSDDDLMGRVRAGDRSAYGELWLRHSVAAHAVARSFSTLDPDDLVAEAFARILAAIGRGAGPSMGFRPYLLTSVRNVAREWGSRDGRVDTADLTDLPDGDDAALEAESALERGATARAFRSLPTRWQEALWYAEVDGLRPRHFAPLLGVAPNAASALLVRARKGFRDAWIATQLKDAASPGCADTLTLLGTHTRGGLSRRDARRVDEHVATCAGCALAWTEARDVSSRLALVLLPLVVGIPASASYAAWAQSGGAQSAAVAWGAGGTGAPGAPVTGTPAVETPGAHGAGRTVRALRSVPKQAVIAAAAVAASLAVGVVAWGVVATATPYAAKVADAPPAPNAADAEAGAPASTTAPSLPPEPTRTAAPRPIPTAPPRIVPAPVSSPTAAPITTPSSSPSPQPSPSPSPSPTVPVPVVPPAPELVADTSAGPTVYPLLSGTGAVAGAVIDVVDADGTRWAQTVADAGGAWSVRDLSGGECTTVASGYLPPGSHVLAARQTVGGQTSPSSTPATITVAAPPAFLSPSPGSSVSSANFVLAIHGVPSASVQRIKLPDTAPCRPTPMALDADGSFSREFSVPDPGEVTLGIRYIDPATGRHGPATFVAFTAD